MRTFRHTFARLPLAVLVTVTACGSGSRGSTTAADVSNAPATTTGSAAASGAPAPASAPVISAPAPVGSAPVAGSGGGAEASALPDAMVTAGGAVYAVSPTTGTVRAEWPDAVVAADGGTAFRFDTRLGRADLVRIDTRSGAEVGRRPVDEPGAWRVAVVSADGRHVVATDGLVDRAHRTDPTRLLVFDTSAPAQPVHLLTQAGTIEPEAIAPDGSVVYVLDHRPTYYRVRSLVVAGGELYDTIGRDKSEPAEDMHGEPVRAVASPDGSLLSTLYRLPSPTAGATPFVHVLDLAHGWSYCADLPPGDYDRIATSPDGRTLVVGATDGAWITVDLTDIGTPGDVPLPLAVHQGGTPPVPLAVGGSAVAGAVTVTVDAGGVAWHTGTAPTGTIASVAWPSGRPNPQLAALLAA